MINCASTYTAAALSPGHRRNPSARAAEPRTGGRPCAEFNFIPVIERVTEVMPDGGVPWSSWRDRPLYVQEGDGVGARSVSGEGWALSLGQSPPGGLCVGSDGGRQRPLISAKSNPPSHRRSRNRVRQGRRRNDPRQAHRRGYPESGDREPRTTNVADHGHDLDRLAIGGLLAPFAEEKSASTRAPAGCATSR